jgi:hypothetical protein
LETPLAQGSLVPTMTDCHLDATDAASIGVRDDRPPSAFLQLPAELRDEIYSHVASTDPASAITFSPQPGATGSRVYHGLLHACKQTRTEYTRALLRYPEITTTVENFDFEPFVAYISELPSSFLDLLPKQLAPLELTASKIEFVNPGAKVHILVNITDDEPTALKGLRRWQVKQCSMEAVGSRFKVDYRFVGRPDLQARLGIQIVFFPGLIDRFEGSDDAITQAELKGMMRALLNGMTSLSDAEEASNALYLLETSGVSPSTINEFLTAYRNIHPVNTL